MTRFWASQRPVERASATILKQIPVLDIYRMILHREELSISFVYLRTMQESTQFTIERASR
jgi:hypothetical protein